MEDEWEEEEQLVVVELSGVINNDVLSGTCKILDIDSDNPMMQIGQCVFAGEYEDAIGSCVVFEESTQKGKSNCGPELKYMCHTTKKLMMQRIFLTEKKEDETSTGGGISTEEDTTCQEGNTSQETDTHGSDLENKAVG